MKKVAIRSFKKKIRGKTCSLLDVLVCSIAVYFIVVLGQRARLYSDSSKPKHLIIDLSSNSKKASSKKTTRKK